MSEPKSAGSKPMIVQVEPGVYWWCACGRSLDQPYCDGSHRDTDITPIRFEIAEKGNKAMCMCKRTGSEPFCDGSHSKT